jgi:hypothetical protein
MKRNTLKTMDLDSFYKAAHLDDSYRKWAFDRRLPCAYADVMIVDAHPSFWYEPFIGMTVFAELVFNDWGRGPFLYDAYVVYLQPTKRVRGRSFDVKHIIIL